MADPFVAEIRIFPYTFPPKGWAFCDGQLMPISQNTGLFALLGTVYGGDGKSTFALPDLQGSAPMHPDYRPEMPMHPLGESSGVETVTLLQAEIPAHAHTLRASNQPGEDPTPGGEALGRSVGASLYQTNTNTGLTAMAPTALALTGASLPHNNMQPYLTFHFCIALVGVFPPRA